MARLPIPGGDAGNWGEILNEFMAVEHHPDGTLIHPAPTEVAAHNAQTDVHGIANTALLETQSGAQAKVDAHAANTTTAHGLDALARKAHLAINVQDYGALGDGTTDDTAAIQAAIDAVEAAGGGAVVLGAGTYRGNVLVGSRVALVGEGSGQTTLKAVAGSDDDVVRGKGFLTWTGTNKQTPETRGDNYVQLVGLTIDGDKATNSSGIGVRLWGRCYLFRDLVVQHCAEDGIWTEFTTHDTGNPEDALEAYYADIKTILNDGNGWTYRGPHDSILSRYVTMGNAGWGFQSGSASGSYSGGISGDHWNSWLNTLGSFDFGGALGGLNHAQATGPYAGTGIRLSAISGTSKMTNILISGHETGLYLRGDNHTFSGVVQDCHNLANTAGAGILIDGANLAVVDATGWGNHVAINWQSEAGPGSYRGRFNVPTGKQLVAGYPNGLSAVDLAAIGVDGNRAWAQQPIDGVTPDVSAVVSNTASETLFSTTLQLPADALRASYNAVRIRAQGVLSNNSGGSVTFTFRVKLGSAAYVTGGGVAIADATTNQPWMMEAVMVCRVDGASGFVDVQGQQIVNGTVELLGSTSLVAVDTTTPHDVGVSVEMDTADAAASAQLRQMIVERLG